MSIETPKLRSGSIYRVLIWAMLNGFEIIEWWSFSHCTVGVWMLSYDSLLICVIDVELVIFVFEVFLFLVYFKWYSDIWLCL